MLKSRIFNKKYHFFYVFKISRDLCELGYKKAFEKNADFSGINASNELFISQIVHQAIIEVNEEGTEAAASTVVRMRKKLKRDVPVVDFICDRPFIFLIHENINQCILYFGRFVNS